MGRERAWKTVIVYFFCNTWLIVYGERSYYLRVELDCFIINSLLRCLHGDQATIINRLFGYIYAVAW
jgi:hypothetical protein